MDTTHQLSVDEDAGTRLDVLVARRLDISRTMAATLIATGRVFVNAGAQKASYRTEAGDAITATVTTTTERPVVGEDIPLHIIFEDDELLVVDKQAGMVVHPAPGNWTGTLVNALMGRGQGLAEGGGEERAGLVHRLDKDTSGLLVVAKTDRSHRILSKAISERRVSRRYALMCWGHLDGDTLTVDRPIGRDPNDRTKMAIALAGRDARTDFVRLARFQSCDFLRAHLHSGRTHQIRVHLTSVGHPVVGDDTYGGGGARRLVELPAKRHFLHAAWLVFKHPVTGEAMDFRSPLPADLRTSLGAISEMPEIIAHPDPLEYLGFYRVDG